MRGRIVGERGLDAPAVDPIELGAGLLAGGAFFGLRNFGRIVAGEEVKQLARFNSVESLVASAGKLTRLKGGVRQGFIQGDVESIFRNLAMQYGVPVQRTASGERFFQAGSIRVGLHVSKGNRLPTLHINQAGQIYKIRVVP